MSERVINPINFLPIFEKWRGFLSTQSAHQTSIPGISEYTDRAQTTYRTSKNVFNTLTFYNAKQYDAVELHPVSFFQDYVASRHMFETQMIVNNQHISSNLYIYYRTNVFNRIVLSAENHLTDNEWQGSQQVFINLTEEYLNQLKTKKLIPEGVRSRIWIRRNHTGDVRPTIDVNGNAETLLSDEALRAICHDAGFEFEIDAKAMETRAKIGDTTINLHHVNIHSLDPDRIWQALTGSDPDNSLIFPVQVNGKNLTDYNYPQK